MLAVGSFVVADLDITWAVGTDTGAGDGGRDHVAIVRVLVAQGRWRG